MTRVAWDTNMVLRVILKDDAGMMSRVAAHLARIHAAGASVWIPINAVQEVHWRLATMKDPHGKRFSRHDVAGGLREFLLTHGVTYEDGPLVLGSLTDWEHGKADFPEYLMARRAGHKGMPLITMDADALKDTGMGFHRPEDDGLPVVRRNPAPRR